MVNPVAVGGKEPQLREWQAALVPRTRPLWVWGLLGDRLLHCALSSSIPCVLSPPAKHTKLTVGMATRVRTASIWVPPLQERNSSWDRIRKLQGQDSVLGQGTLGLQHLPGAPRQKRKSRRTEKVLEWLFISQEQPKVTTSWGINTPNLISSSSWNKEKSCVWCRPKFQISPVQTQSGKLMILWNGIRKIKTSWEVRQKALNALHLENYVFLVQIIFQDKNLINVARMERV
ncbi:zinc finger protein 268 isoform X6 [Chlorocebus sabaeus]|uniref:zinc finger protein 268 isoform X6 n=1 Tax=Chlorocebus sabaeus TaxID=60711 RepID=UPI0018B06858|nr:zinc finger protein 268 isoform X6 [Chlorocebus sabaeus]